MRCKTCCVLGLFVFYVFAEDITENIISTESEINYATELSENLEFLRKNPIDITTVKIKKLRELLWLSETEIQKIIFHQKEIFKLADLLKIGINEITISEIQDYICFQKQENYEISQRLRLEMKEENVKEKSCLKTYQRTIVTSENIKFGLLTQKDEFEHSLIDFYAPFLEFTQDAILRKIILGKYRLALGQGILFAPKLGISKSGATTTLPMKNFKPLKPYTSSYEIWFMNGFATQLSGESFSLIPFYSNAKFSANLADDKITSFNESGVHLDNLEKDNVSEKIFGSSFCFEKDAGQIGLNFAKINFDHQFENSAYLANYSAVSLDFLFHKKEFSIFGEVANSAEKFGGVMGVKFGEDKFRQLILTRFYEKNFPTWNGHAFSSQSKFDNEIGVYYGLTILLFSRTRISCFFDVWQFPQTQYFEKMPTVGSEEFLQIEHKFDENNVRFVLQHKNKEKYIKLEETLIRDFQRTTMRLDFWQKIGKMRLKTRGEFVTEYLQNEQIWERGILAFQQLKWKQKMFETIMQITVYHSTVLHYMYENSVDGVMENAILSGDGICSFLLLKYKFSPSMQLQFKISEDWQQPKETKFYLQLVSNL